MKIQNLSDCDKRKCERFLRVHWGQYQHPNIKMSSYQNRDSHVKDKTVEHGNAITWTNVDLSSVRFWNILLIGNSQETTHSWVTKVSLKISFPKFHLNLPRANELSNTPVHTQDFNLVIPEVAYDLALTHCGLVISCCDIDLDQYWLRLWLAA